MTLECRVKQKIDESETGYYLVAEIVNILCDEKYLAEDGKPDVEKMELITFDPVHHTYIQLGKTVGNAFSDGKQFLKEQLYWANISCDLFHYRKNSNVLKSTYYIYTISY